MRKEGIFLATVLLVVFGFVVYFVATEQSETDGTCLLSGQAHEELSELYEYSPRVESYLVSDDLFVSFEHSLSSGVHVAELLDLVQVLALERQEASGLSEGFRLYENLHYHPDYRPDMNDLRLALLDEVGRLFSEARTIQDTARSINTERRSVINLWGEPDYYNDTFTVGLLREEYLELVDFISHFTGISRVEMNVVVVGPLSQLPSGQSEGYGYWFDEELADGVEPHSSTVLPMGTRLDFRNPGGQLRDLGTLGHARDHNGRSGFSRSHRTVQQGASVYAGGRHVGFVRRSVFEPHNGLDISYIDFVGFTVSNLNPITSMPISHFFATVNGRDSVTVITRSARRTGSVLHVSQRLRIDRYYDPSLHDEYSNVIVTNINAFGGDSGGALIQNNMTVGTLIGGGIGMSAFSRSPSYQSIR